MGRDRSGSVPSAQPSSASAAPAAPADPAAARGRALDRRAALFMAGRTALMLVGIAVMALGVDLVVKADLGNSPISATPNVLSIAFDEVSFGTFMLGWQCFLVLAQIVILRREFRLIDLLQIPISVFFGLCIDFFMALLAPFSPASYALSWVWLAGGVAVMALGIVMTVVSGTVMNCGEALVQAVVRKTGARFGTVKVGFDLTCAALAVVCAFAFTGHLVGVREGTVVCAALAGVIVNVYMGIYGKLREKVRAGRKTAIINQFESDAGAGDEVPAV